MRKRATTALLALAVFAPSALAHAQARGPGLGRALDRPLPRPPERDAEAGAGDEEELRWPGPQIQLAYGYTKLADGFGGGDSHVGAILVFVQWPVHELRTSVRGAIGSRDYSLAGDDFLVRGGVEVGFQLPHLIDPLVPHVSAVFSLGAIVGERYETTVSHVFGGGGVEIGAELRVVRNLHLAAAFGYQRWEMDGAGFDLFMLRVGVGL